MSFAKTGRRKGGHVEPYERRIVWILNLGLEGEQLKGFFCVFYDGENDIIFSFSIFFSVNRSDFSPVCRILSYLFLKIARSLGSFP